MAAVAKMVALGKPVVFWKTGRSDASAAQIASHTGSLAGNARIFEAALRAAGAIVVQDEAAFVDAVALASAGRIPAGRRLGVVTASGGYAIVTLDAAERFGIDVPEATVPPTEAQQAALGPAHFVNPFDVYALFGRGRRSFEAALQWMDAQPVDAIAIWLSYACMGETVQAIVHDRPHRLRGRQRQAGVLLWPDDSGVRGRTSRSGRPLVRGPTRLVQALGETAPRARPAGTLEPFAPAGARDIVAGKKARAILAGLKALPQVRTEAVANTAEAVALQRELDGRVFLKLEGERLAHKTEVGGVVGPLDAGAVAAAYAQLAAVRAELADPSAAIVLQPSEEGVELALGAFVDDVFGPSVMVAVGGIFLEVLKDAQFAPAPVTAEQARDMILSLRGAPLLLGARGKPPCDIDAAAAALAELSRFIAAHAADYREIDINPLMVRGKGRGVVAVDALIVATRSQDL